MRVLQDVKLERAAVGAILASHGKRDHLLAELRVADFTDELAGEVFRAMSELAIGGRPCRTDLVAAALRARKREHEAMQLGELALSAMSPRSAELLVRGVRELAGLRDLCALDPAQEVLATDADLDAAVQSVRAKVDAIGLRTRTRTIVDGLELAKLADDRLRAAREGGGQLRGISTGFTRLDRVLSGLRNAGLYTIGARPSMGKTALALNIAMHVVLKLRRRVLVFSLEMGPGEVADRITASEGRVSTEKVATGRLEGDEWDRAGVALSRLSESGLMVDERGSLTINELLSTANGVHSDNEIGLVVVDYLQLVKGSVRRRESRQEEVAEVARSLKELARKLDRPVLALSQLNRELEKRSLNDRRPTLADFRESGEIEQASNVVMGLHRQHVYDSAVDPTFAELAILKNREGPKGLVALTWAPELVRFSNRSEV